MPDRADIGAAKRELRARLLAARRTRPADDLRRLDVDLLDAVAAWLDARGAGGTVAGYAPMRGEPGGPALPGCLAAHADRVLLPVLRDDNDLDWATYHDELAPARLGLAEPPGPRLGPDAVGTAGVLIVPALAVDARGMRLGRGGGSYDRALARIGRKAVVLALLYPGERVPEVPTLVHDRPVHGVVIDGRVRMVGSGM